MPNKNHKSEPVQPGNPHKLVRKQHVFPRACIERFYGADKKVSVAIANPKELGEDQQSLLRVNAESWLFWAQRVWDERAESGYMKQIEDQFQNVAEQILRGDSRWLPFQSKLITMFFVLWEQRMRYAANPVPAVQAKGVTPNHGLTKDQKEHLEKNHYLFIDEDGKMPGRQLTGMYIQRSIDYRHSQLQNTKWFVCRAAPDAGEFLVPDFPQTLFIPLSPTVALAGDFDMPLADAAHVKFFNTVLASGCHQFVFARDFVKCFVPESRRAFTEAEHCRA